MVRYQRLLRGDARRVRCRAGFQIALRHESAVRGAYPRRKRAGMRHPGRGHTAADLSAGSSASDLERAAAKSPDGRLAACHTARNHAAAWRARHDHGDPGGYDGDTGHDDGHPRCHHCDARHNDSHSGCHNRHTRHYNADSRRDNGHAECDQRNARGNHWSNRRRERCCNLGRRIGYIRRGRRRRGPLRRECRTWSLIVRLVTCSAAT
jgi:hypothetical protein